MAANTTFQQLVQKLYHSNLHFHLSETPFSAQILIRKRFLKDTIGPSSTFEEDDESSKLKDQILELRKQVKNSSDVINSLENKLSEAEAQAKKSYEEKKIEIEAFKNSVKKGELVAKNLKKDLEAEHKVVKENEKLIQKLEHKNGILNINYKNLKAEVNKVKNENKKLLKNRSQSDNDVARTQESATLEKLELEYENDLNQNMQSAKSSQLCSLSSSARAPPLTPPRADTSPPSPVTPTCASLSTTPPGTPPGASTGSTATVAHAGVCSHSPQCTSRQPRPPPPDKCTVLVHHGSKYHEHMDSQIGVPHQLGVTHEYCMRIEYENYGCEDCKWFKRWGELHGYPDINPWNFKEHRQPLTYL